MKTLSNTTKRTSLAALFSLAIVGFAIATPSHADEMMQSQVLAAHTSELNTQMMQAEQELELELEQQTSEQVAAAESQFVAKICQHNDLGYDAETSSCIR
ncbi:hypothetical protein [Shewanella gaetbuli]|uniref:Uncharacterized protein n=1 Tax=Shewanella gaetbuli TaxID=220752 RepID=A0A9X1ZJS9_9GAMM|nr:hypothetical protein [Shewanella gaetbuli]MCL1141172.1 hypothetical protein [Shewanella gaetbuli]